MGVSDGNKGLYISVRSALPPHRPRLCLCLSWPPISSFLTHSASHCSKCRSDNTATLPKPFQDFHCPGNGHLDPICKTRRTVTSLHCGLTSLALSFLSLTLWPNPSSMSVLFPPGDRSPCGLLCVWTPGSILFCKTPVKPHLLREASQDYTI